MNCKISLPLLNKTINMIEYLGTCDSWLEWPQWHYLWSRMINGKAWKFKPQAGHAQKWSIFFGLFNKKQVFEPNWIEFNSQLNYIFSEYLLTAKTALTNQKNKL